MIVHHQEKSKTVRLSERFLLIIQSHQTTRILYHPPRHYN